MAADGWAEAARQQLGMGRLLPLGGPADGAWISEHAAATVLRRAAEVTDRVRVGRLRISLADPDMAGTPAVPPPVSALPPGPLRIEADVELSVRTPLPQQAERLREVLLGAAGDRIGLDATAVDLRITGLLEEEPPSVSAGPRESEGNGTRDTPGGGPAAGEHRGRAGPEQPSGDLVAAAVAAVPGVVRPAPVLGPPARAVRVDGSHAPDHRHVQVQVAVATTHRALDVTAAIRAAVTAAAHAESSAPVTVAVVVTAVEAP
jgi:hypothetical protein